MNKYLFIDAISHLDIKLIEEHITMRQKMKINKIIKKKYNILKKTLIASCFALLFLSTFFIFNLLSYINSEEITSTATTSYLAISLIISLVCAVIIGIVAWTIGKRIIKKNCKYENLRKLQ